MLSMYSMARMNLDNNNNNPRVNGSVNAHMRFAVFINKRLNIIDITIYSSAPLYNKRQRKLLGHASVSE